MTEEEKVAVLWEIAQTVAKGETICSDDFGDQECNFCFGDQDYSDSDNYKHTPDCIVIKARALIEGKSE